MAARAETTGAKAEVAAETSAQPVLRWYSPVWWTGLVEMYTTYEPKRVYLGLPPPYPELIERWLTKLLGEPANTNLIITHGARVVGHAALVHYPDEPDSQEIVLFIHQDYQRLGLGRRFFQAIMHRGCRHLGLKRVWLEVNRENRRGVRMYRLLGFEPTADSMLQPEITMNRFMSCDECLEDQCQLYTSDMVRHLCIGTLE